MNFKSFTHSDHVLVTFLSYRPWRKLKNRCEFIFRAKKLQKFLTGQLEIWSTGRFWVFLLPKWISFTRVTQIMVPWLFCPIGHDENRKIGLDPSSGLSGFKSYWPVNLKFGRQVDFWFFCSQNKFQVFLWKIDRVTSKNTCVIKKMCSKYEDKIGNFWTSDHTENLKHILELAYPKTPRRTKFQLSSSNRS